MDLLDLSTTAQIGATLAGFATLAGAIRGTVYDSDAIYDVVANSLIALGFSLFAMKFGATLGGLRVLALALAVAGAVMVARDIRVVIAAIRDDSATYDLTSAILGWSYMLVILSSPFLAVGAVANLWPGESAHLFESALLAHLAASILMLLDVVRRSLALSGVPPDRP